MSIQIKATQVVQSEQPQSPSSYRTGRSLSQSSSAPVWCALR